MNEEKEKLNDEKYDVPCANQNMAAAETWRRAYNAEQDRCIALTAERDSLRTELAAVKEREQGLREALDKVFWSAVMAEGEAGYLLGDIKQIAQDALSRPPQSPWRNIAEAPKDGTEVLGWFGGLGAAVTSFWPAHNVWCGKFAPKAPTHFMPIPQPPTKGEESNE